VDFDRWKKISRAYLSTILDCPASDISRRKYQIANIYGAFDTIFDCIGELSDSTESGKVDL
jgi:hypothetical protein